MSSTKTILSFNGFINHNDITRLVNEFVAFAQKLNISNSITKKVIVLMIEILENSFHYTKALHNELPENIEKPFFSILKSQKAFILISSNPIKSEDVDQLKEKIKEINSCKKEFLKEMYLKKLIDSINENKSSPGIGLIRLAKITQNKINCSFNQFDNKFLNYRLEIIVNSQ